MSRLLKVQTIAIFVLSIILCLAELILIIIAGIELKLLNNLWTSVGFLFISAFLFVFQAGLLIFSVMTFFDIADMEIKNRYYYISRIAVVLSVLPIIASLIMNIYCYNYF